MGGYGYEIIGGLLIVLSSLVGEQMKPKWKMSFYVLFATVALGYSGIGIYLRRETNIRDEKERQERRDELKGVRQDLSNMLLSFRQFGPSVASLNSDVANMRRDLETAKEKHDPHKMAELEAKARVAQRGVDEAAKAYLVAMVPGTVRQLRAWHGSWSSPEGEELIMQADYLRKGLSQGLQQTPEDTTASALFVTTSGTGRANGDPEQAARYLEKLISRTGIALPPTGLSGTTQ